ncbi:hypothetical protein GCM10007857_31430 [Bradyrhizobium iriomotense]|uniref:Uncharacterized protein n=1 Tax=Bradyrhizobium iriomotense TaxID=441950 RepID=A0ABQ6B2X2_9BRAD|nr:hypothetical protein GCM10007857_31430 [Bradyrhizobium iriomotense]
MALVTVRPTGIDTAIADEIAAHANPGMEEAAEALTWGADESMRRCGAPRHGQSPTMRSLCHS